MRRKRQIWTSVLLLLMLSIGNLAGQSNLNLVKKGITVRAALSEVEKQTGYSVDFDEKVLDPNRTLNLQLQNRTLDDVMKEILKNSNCSYSIKNKHIIIVPSGNTNTRPSGSASSTHAIRGMVSDGNEPLIGVTIQVEGSSLATVTDVNGNFNLNLPQKGAVLTVSYLGYSTQKVSTNKDDFYKVVLKVDNKTLDEVVVVGYNTVKKRDLTTAVASVSTKDISERPITDAAQAIQGKAAGVQVVQPSGKPGAGLSIRVRGATSVNADNEPLYIVDGMPSDDISNVNPNDIESMQILKDASSAAIYGARAANGVVLITTKRGKAGKMLLKFNAYSGVSRLGKTIDALNTEQYKQLMKELLVVSSAAPSIPTSETRYTNWSDEYFRTGTNQNYQLSLGGGSDQLQYFVSAGYMNEKGIVQKANFRRYSFRTNIDSKIMDRLKMGINITYANAGGRDVYESRSAFRAGSILAVINTPPFMQIWDPDNPSQYDEDAYGSRISNPFAANDADQNYSADRLISSMNFTLELAKNLSFKTSFGIDLNNKKSNYFLDPNRSSDGRSTKGRVEEGYSRNFEWLLENTLSYNATLNKRHHLNLLGGATLQNAKNEAANIAGYDLLTTYPNLRTVSAANQIDKDETYSTATEWALSSFVGSVMYNYDSKYLFTSNVRMDGSSRFAPGKRWGIFPSFSAGWRISSEPFMQSLKSVVNDLKLRAGWGLNGNQSGIGNYSYLAYYSTTRVTPTTDNTLPGLALSPYSAANSDLTWEKTTQTNVGIDLSLFDSRVVFTADAYYKKTTDLLLTLTLPDNVNLPGGITRNDGQMVNKGLEFAVSSRNITGKFLWNTDFNISFNRNKLTKLSLNKLYYYAEMYSNNERAIILKEGLPLGSFYGFVSEGVDPETGNIIYKDLDNNGIINSSDRTVIGSAQPNFIYGLTNSFSYKGFDLSLMLQGSQGNKIFNATRIDTEGMIDFRNQSTEVLKRWMRPGMITSVPKVGNKENIHNSSRYVEDGSYLRLKNITLSYTLPSRWVKKLQMSKVQPYVTAQNLLTFTSYSGYDPEVNAYGNDAVALGIDYGTYPQSKSVIFGINIEF